MGQTTTAKTCMVCKQDCSGRPRVKDPQGRYICRACLDAATKSSAADARTAAVRAGVARARERRAGLDLSDGAGAALPGLAPRADTAPCAACGMPVAPVVIVCPSCGFSKQTGNAPRRVKVAHAGPAAADVAGAAARALIFSNPVFWLAAACIAGAIGAGAWYLMVTRTGHEVRLVTLGIGTMVGFTVKLSSGRHSGPLSGGIAAAVTLGAIGAGYWFTYQHLVGQFERDNDLQHALDVTDQQALVEYARVRAQTLESARQTLPWPEGVDAESAADPEDFPPALWTEAAAAWSKATPEWRDRFTADVRERLRGDYEDAKGDGFVSYVFLEDGGLPATGSLLMLGGSLLAALFVGSGGALSAAAASRMR